MPWPTPVSDADLRHLMPRLEWAAVKVSELGPRVLLELLLETGCANDCMIDVIDRLMGYSQLTPELVWLAGADPMINRQ